MKTPIMRTIAVFGGAATVALTVGSGVSGVSPTATGATTATHSPSAVAPARPDPAGPGVHIATLVGCIPGANC